MTLDELLKVIRQHDEEMKPYREVLEFRSMKFIRQLEIQRLDYLEHRRMEVIQSV